jgi:4-hydroxy-2-oxoheptanedioate aldolase
MKQSIVVVLLAVFVGSSLGHGQEGARPPQHLNPAVEKLAKGLPLLGISTEDYSLANAQGIARSGADFVRMEMEHAPLNFEAIRIFLLGMNDKAAYLKSGSAQLPIAPFIRVPNYGRDSADWIVKQMLDIGVMGIKFPTINNKEEALRAVRSMRYAQPVGSKYMEPAGLRGVGAGNAVWFWGVSSAEYDRHADIWPLNPDGDLVSIIMIETAEGLKNVDEIASVPGVSILFVGSAGDLPHSLGVPPSSPVIEDAMQKVLKSCKAHNVVCGGLAKANDVQKRIKEGWRYLDLGRAGAGLTADDDAALKAGRAALK